MSKSTVEDAIEASVKLLQDIGRALRANDDELLKKFCKRADSSARELDSARQQMHSNWDE